MEPEDQRPRRGWLPGGAAARLGAARDSVLGSGREALSAAAGAAGGLRGRLGGHDVDDDAADPDSAVDTLDDAELHDEELEALDADVQVADADGLDLEHLTDVLLGLQQAPALPLVGPFTVSFPELLLAWADLAGQQGFLADERVSRILRLLGSRLAIVVDADGITVRGLLRRRHTPWERINGLEFAERYLMLRDHVLEGFADDVVRSVRVPVPGLRWLVRRIVGALEHLVPDTEMERLREVGGRALVRIDRRGFDLEMRGALGLLTFLSTALSEVLAFEAEQRAVTVLP